MQSIKVASVSMNGFLGEPDRVLKAIGGWCERAAADKAQLVLFPELVVHGHCTPNTYDLAEAIPDGPSTQRLVQLAKHYKLFLSVGMSEKERDIVYNTQVLVGPDGFIGKQRKLHLSRDEVIFYKGGRELLVFDIGPCKVGTSICYDTQFPEVSRILALKGADVLLLPHAARIKMWDETPASQAAARKHSHDYFRLYGLRAIENACFAVVSDQVGRAGLVDTYPKDHFNQPNHAGAALIIGPDGEVLASTQEKEIKEEMISATLDSALLAVL